MSLSSVCRRSSPRHSIPLIFQTAVENGHQAYHASARDTKSGRTYSTEQPVLRRELRPWLSARAVPPPRKVSRRDPQQQCTVAPIRQTDHSSHDRLRAIVDIYPSFQLPSHARRIRPDRHPPVQFHHSPRESSPVPAKKAESGAVGRRVILVPDGPTAESVQQLNRLLNDPNTTPDAIFAAYQLLPQPRLSYLGFSTIRALQSALRKSDRKTRHGMIRYFTLLDDMSVAKIPLRRQEWNLATAFAARWADEVGQHNVNTAMQMFLRMEKEAGIVANNVTFNILFDMAARAQRFGLAEVIVEEMERRGISPDGFFYTSKIFYHGMRRDGEGIRQTYRDMIDAGEVIDTKVLTCVVVSLIRAGEAGAGEQVFERMKVLAGDEARAAARVSSGDTDPHRSAEPERLSPVRVSTTTVGPNVHTYRALIRHHANKTGNIDRVIELLLEMQQHGLTWHGSIFWQIFSGFRRHGGIRFTSWSIRRLDELWRLFLVRVDQASESDLVPDHLLPKDERPCCINVQIATAVLLAYAKCGDPVLVGQVWQDIATRWTPDEDELDQIRTVMDDIKRRQDCSVFD